MTGNNNARTGRTDSLDTLSAQIDANSTMALADKSCYNYNGDFRYCVTTHENQIIFDTTTDGKELKYNVAIATAIAEKEAKKTSTGTVDLPFIVTTACAAEYTQETANYLNESQDNVDIDSVSMKVEWPDNDNIQFDYKNELAAYRPSQTKEQAKSELLEDTVDLVKSLVFEAVETATSVAFSVGDFIFDAFEAKDLTTGKEFNYQVNRKNGFAYAHPISFEVATGSSPFPITITNAMFIDNFKVDNSLEYTVYPAE